MTVFNKMVSLNISNKKAVYGFTLIELVVTIILLGIMVTTVIPRFLTSEGFAEYTYRDELIIKLRAIQLRSMQQTNNIACQTISFNSTQVGLLATITNTNTCDSDLAGDTTKVTISSSDSISFSISENLPSFSFSSMGRPVGCIAKDPCDITLTVTGSDSLSVFINEEGFIYAL